LSSYLDTVLQPQAEIRVDCVHQLFEVQADERSADPAIIYQSVAISYGEVEARSNQLARLLQGRGVVCGSRVGLLIPRSPELYISILAILKAGGAYIPLDPEYPIDRIEYILSDCAVQTIVTTTFAAGAALVVGSIDQTRSGVDLAHFLAGERVTVLSGNELKPPLSSVGM
jgi:non-ribosomal peptide synthetase component F